VPDEILQESERHRARARASACATTTTTTRNPVFVCRMGKQYDVCDV
jgi:hypothetical protein